MPSPLELLAGTRAGRASPPRVDIAHPLARGLVGYWVEQDGILWDAVRGRVVALASGQTSVKTALGRAIDTAAAGADTGCARPQIANCSVAAVFRLDTLGSGTPFYQWVIGDGATGIALGHSRSSWTGNLDAFAFRADTQFFGQSHATASAPAVDTWYSMVGVYSAAGDYLAVYPGLDTGSSGGVTHGYPAEPGTSNLLVGTDGVDAMDGKVLVAAYWSRALTALEAKRFNADPLGLLARPRRLVYLGGAAAAAQQQQLMMMGVGA